MTKLNKLDKRDRRAAIAMKRDLLRSMMVAAQHSAAQRRPVWSSNPALINPNHPSQRRFDR